MKNKRDIDLEILIGGSKRKKVSAKNLNIFTTQ